MKYKAFIVKYRKNYKIHLGNCHVWSIFYSEHWTKTWGGVRAGSFVINNKSCILKLSTFRDANVVVSIGIILHLYIIEDVEDIHEDPIYYLITLVKKIQGNLRVGLALSLAFKKAEALAINSSWI